MSISAIGSLQSGILSSSSTGGRSTTATERMARSAAESRAVAAQLASQGGRPDVRISFDDPSKHFVYRYVSNETGAVVNQYPNQSALRQMATNRQQTMGAFIDYIS